MRLFSSSDPQLRYLNRPRRSNNLNLQPQRCRSRPSLLPLPQTDHLELANRWRRNRLGWGLYALYGRYVYIMFQKMLLQR